MEIGCFSGSHRRMFESGEWDIFDWMACCADELRIGGVEIAREHLAESAEDYLFLVRRAAVDLHLTISAVAVAIDFGRAAEKDLVEGLDELARGAKAARMLGAPVVRFSAGTPEGDSEERWKTMSECVRLSCETAAAEGVVLAVESGGGFLRMAEDAGRLMASAESEWLRLNLTAGGFADGLVSVRRSLGAIAHVSARMRGDGVVAEEFPSLIALLKKENYRGFVSIDYEGEEDARAAVPRGIAHLRRLIHE